MLSLGLKTKIFVTWVVTIGVEINLKWVKTCSYVSKNPKFHQKKVDLERSDNEMKVWRSRSQKCAEEIRACTNAGR